MLFFNTLSWYLVRIYSSRFFMTTAGILFIISIFEGTEIIRRSLGKSYIPAKRILEMVVLSLPNHFEALAPFLIFITTLIVFWRLNQTNELIILRSIGFSIWQIIFVFLSLVLLIGFFNLFILSPISSATTARREHLNSQYFSTTPYKLSVSDSGVWLRETLPDAQVVINAQQMDLNNGVFHDVTFFIYDSDNNFKQRLDAQKIILKNQKWELININKWSPEKPYEHTKTMDLNTNFSLEKICNSYSKPDMIAFWKLPKFIKILEKSGLSSAVYKLHWHRHIANVGLMIALVLLAIVFSVHPIRQGKTAYMIAAALMCGFLLHFLNDIIRAYGLSGRLPIVLAAWASPLITVLLSSSTLLHLEDG